VIEALGGSQGDALYAVNCENTNKFYHSPNYSKATDTASPRNDTVVVKRIRGFRNEVVAKMAFRELNFLRLIRHKNVRM
jgi:hypothetical protein